VNVEDIKAISQVFSQGYYGALCFFNRSSSTTTKIDRPRLR
jgi:hypothetical protein